jgi:hypothetical protein
MNENVLNKLLSRHIEKKVSLPKRPKAPGRPKVSEEKKARNFTLCLAPEYLNFLDKMVVKDRKIQGRGRKIRFIIERFIEHERRSIEHLKVLKRSLGDVQKTLEGFSSKVKKGEKLNLSIKERTQIDKAVDQVHVLLKILSYSPKTLHKMLPHEEWSVLSFCLDWRMNKGVRL